MLPELIGAICEISKEFKASRNVFIVFLDMFCPFCGVFDPFLDGTLNEIGQVSGESTTQQFRRTMSTLVRQTSKSSSLRWEESERTGFRHEKQVSLGFCSRRRTWTVWQDHFGMQKFAIHYSLLLDIVDDLKANHEIAI